MNREEIRKALKEEYAVHNGFYNTWLEKKDSKFYEREVNFNEGWCMGLGFALDLIGWGVGETIGRDFMDDECKMVDFLALSKDEFLRSYSYLDSRDWDATYVKMLKMLKERGFSITFDEELGHEACKWSVNGECTLMCDDNRCAGTPDEKWECALYG